MATGLMAGHRPGRNGLLALLLLLWAAAASAGDPSGQWRGSVQGQTLSLDLRADGSGTFNGTRLRWQRLGSMLLVEIGGSVTAYAYSLDGGRLLLSGGDLPGVLALDRGSVAATGQAPSEPTPAGGESLDPTLVGRWCFVSSFTANAGGGSQTERCFELGADGRYAYRAEGSMSAYAPGMWGGTTSSAADSGRWRVSAGGGITAYSDSGRVYRYALEKRNHPRNGDPMICLDGECYATYYQKPPW